VPSGTLSLSAEGERKRLQVVGPSAAYRVDLGHEKETPYHTEGLSGRNALFNNGADPASVLLMTASFGKPVDVWLALCEGVSDCVCDWEAVSDGDCDGVCD